MLDHVGDRCCGCFACFNICPHCCIEMKENEEGFLYPKVDSSACVKCGFCERVCPVLHPVKKTRSIAVYAAYRNDFDKRMESASGGIFSLLAEKIIENGGIVYGAAFDENMMVSHIAVKQNDDLKLLKGSKYIQSAIGFSFKEIKKALEAGIFILFSGTPCQVAGLSGFLGKEYDNLLKVSVICHGVPSPGLWRAYIDEKFGSNIVKAMSFRNKTDGMSNAVLDYTLSDGSIVKEKYRDSIWQKGYTQNLFLRESCYQCRFKGYPAGNDITIGDFWGLQSIHPEFYDEYGVSAVLLNTIKGEKWFKMIKNDCTFIQVRAKDVEIGNESLIKPAKRNTRRKVFFTRIRVGESIESVITSLYDESFWNTPRQAVLIHIAKKIKTLLGR